MSSTDSYPFVHLHNHSDFSLLDGSASVDSLAKMAKSQGMEAVALTDHGNMLGALYFQKACQKAGVKAIIGCEVYVAPKSRFDHSGNGQDERRYYHMCLLATNEVGYHNLLILTSAGYTEGFYYKPRVDDELLKQYHEGIIATSACLAGEISRHLLDRKYELAKERALFYSNLFGPDHYYLEIQEHGLSEDVIIRREMKKLSNETGIPLVATNDVHYINKSDENDNDIFICIGTQRKKSDVNRMRASPNCYFRTAKEMHEIFYDSPEALTNSVKIARMCNFEINLPGPKLPDYKIPEAYTDSESYFRYLVDQGLHYRYNTVTETIRNRAEFELQTIIQMGFVGYFLIVWDFIDWAKNHMISVGPGRGSGAGSIIAYALRITDIDPLKYNLLFERFLNPERVSMPDFDIDFNDERRDEVIDYVTNKYGADHVAGITTYSTLQTKAVLKDVARVLDIPYDQSLLITKAVPADENSVQAALKASPTLKEFESRGGIYSELFDVATRLEGLVRGTGVHACGKVIGQSRVVDFVPLIVDQKSKAINTAFESKLIEDCGLVKMDFLGLITLSIIDRCIDLIKKQYPTFNIETIPEDDELTFKLFCEGKSEAIFQFESEGMQKILMDTKPSSIEDLIALNALYRPGPMQFIPDFIKGKKNPHSVKYFHPSLEEVLKPTYGVIVYQEQVMQVAQIYAGYSLGGADLLRRAMSKKNKEEMDKQQAIFIEGAKKNGHSAQDAEELFHILEPFAGYGFNKSHAAAYSVLAYKTAYLKAHYPAEFMASNLTKMSGNPSYFTKYLNESRIMGIELLPPDINHSSSDFSATDGKIYYGFLALKGIGIAVVNEIIESRKKMGDFTSFIDFLEKCPLESTSKRTIEILIHAGMFDRCEKKYHRGELLANADAAIDWILQKKASEKSGPGLFDMLDDDEIAHNDYIFSTALDLTNTERLEHEKEIVGFYISGHPLDQFKGAWQQESSLDLSKSDSAVSGRKYTIIGLIRDIVIRQTKKGEPMLTCILEDYHGTIAIVAFNSVLQPFSSLFIENQALMFRGIVDNSRGDSQFRVEEVTLPDKGITAVRSSKKELTEIHLYINHTLLNDDQLYRLRELLAEHLGSASLYFHLDKLDGLASVTIKAGDPFKIMLSNNLIDSLKSFSFIETVKTS